MELIRHYKKVEGKEGWVAEYVPSLRRGGLMKSSPPKGTEIPLHWNIQWNLPDSRQFPVGTHLLTRPVRDSRGEAVRLEWKIVEARR